MSVSTADRSLRARMAAHSAHAKHDSTRLTAPARRAFFQRFLDQVDPNGELPDAERERRAKHALKAWMCRLSMKAAEAKRARQQAGDPELDGLIAEAMELEAAHAA